MINKCKYLLYGLCAGSIILAVTGCDMIKSMKGSDAKSESQPAPAKVQATPKTPQKSSKEFSANTLAQVGSWTITIDQFEERLDALQELVPEFDPNDAESKELVLEELINQQLIVEGAQKKGIPNNKEVEAAIEEFRRTLIVREVARQLTENIEVTEQEAQDYYDEKRDLLIQPPEWRVSEIVTETQDQANALLIEVLKGGDFAEIARTNSISASADNGGDLGVLTEEPFPAMVNAILALEEGDVSTVFKGPEGFYIIKITSKKGGEQIPFEDIKDDIMTSQTMLKQQEAIIKHIEQLKKTVPVKVNKNLL